MTKLPITSVEEDDPQAVFLAIVKRYIDERVTPQGGARDIGEADIDLRFTHHVPLTDQVRDQHDAVRNNFKEFAMVLTGLPAGREKSLAYTALEEASFWAHAAVARQKGNQP